MEKKVLGQRIVSLAGALLFLLFGANLGEGQFCLGDRILTMLGLPAWSRGTQGLHYPGIIAVVGLMLSFSFFSATTKNPGKTTAWLILGTVVGMYFLSKII